MRALIVQSDSPVDEIQDTLLGILGYDDMDFIQELVTRREEIVQEIVDPVLFCFHSNPLRHSPQNLWRWSQ